MTIRGVSHLTFIVRDLERTAALFCQALGAVEVYDSKDRQFSLSHEKFLLLGGLWLAFMQGKPLGRSYRHVAFAVDGDEGRSLYFYDFDNNLFELHTGTLQERLERYAR